MKKLFFMIALVMGLVFGANAQTNVDTIYSDTNCYEFVGDTSFLFDLNNDSIKYGTFYIEFDAEGFDDDTLGVVFGNIEYIFFDSIYYTHDTTYDTIYIGDVIDTIITNIDTITHSDYYPLFKNGHNTLVVEDSLNYLIFGLVHFFVDSGEVIRKDMNHPIIKNVVVTIPNDTTIVGIDEIDNEYMNAFLYPNPTNDYINILGENIDFVTVYTINGIICDIVRKNVINVTNYNSGVYIVRVTYKDKRFKTFKIIKY